MSALTHCHDDAFGPAVSDCPHRFDFTLLFEDVVLSIIPSFLFLLLGAVRLYQLPRRERVVSGPSLRLSKQGLLIAYLGVQVTLLILWNTTRSVHNFASVAAAALSVFEGLVLCALSWFEHDRNIRPSTILVVYLGFSLLFGSVRARTLWYIQPYSTIAISMISSTILNGTCFLLEATEKRRYFLRPQAWYGPERSSGIISISFYFWLSSLFKQGSQRRLILTMLPRLDRDMSAQRMSDSFVKNWEELTRTGGNEHTIIVSASLVLWRQLVIPIPFRLVFLGFTVCQPLLMQSLLEYLANNRDGQLNDQGRGLIGAYAIVYTGMAVSFGLYWYYSFSMLTRLRACLVGALGRRSAKIDMCSTADPQAVLTLMSADVERTVEGLRGLHELWASTLQAGIAVYLVQRQVGVACVAPIALTIVTSMTTIWISSRTKSKQGAWMEAIQKRIATTSTMLASLKDIKAKGLENAFSRVVTNLRSQEIEKGNRFRRIIAYAGVLSFVPEFMGPFVTFAVLAFAPHFASISLDATRVFTTLSSLLLLAQPLALIFQLLPMLLGAFNCLHRIGDFLLKDDQIDPWTVWPKPVDASGLFNLDGDNQIPEKSIPHTAVAIDPDNQTPLENGEMLRISNGNFGWTSDEIVLHNLNLSVYRGQLIAITGPVGSGKSTLCESLLGQTKLISGQCWLNTVHDGIAYCSQTPYLTNTSIRDNVIACMDYDYQWYKTSLHLSGLASEVEGLAGKDNFLIGSNGLKLSGGQRQRLALARAVYSRRKFIVLDDVFSGIDRASAERIFENLLGSSGVFRLQSRTVIMVSHSQDHLSQVDHVITLDATGSLIRNEQRTVSPSTLLLNSQAEFTKAEPLVDQIPLAARMHDGEMENTCVQSDGAEMAEQSAPRVSDFATYRYYVHAAGRVRFLILVCFCIGLATFFNYANIWLRNWTDHNARYGDNRNGYYLGVYAAFQFMTVLCLGGVAYQALQEVIAQSGRWLHGILLHAVLEAPISFFTTTDIGEIINRFSQDMQLVDGELPQALMNLLLCLATVIGQIVLIIVTSPWTGLTFPPLVLLLYVIQKFYLRTSKQIRFLDLESKSPLYTYFMDSLKGMSTIRAFGWTHQRQQKLDGLLDDSQKPFYLLFMVQQWLALILDLMVTGIAVIIVAAAVYLNSEGSSTGVALVQVMSLNAILRQIIMTWTQIESSIGAVSRVQKFGENTPSEASNNTYEEPPPSWPSEGQIEFCKVSASYQASSGMNVLHEVDLKIEPHEKIGLCGHSGSGKSSLCLSLLRMTSITAGTITIDGVDISKLSPKIVRSNFNVIPQDPVFLPTSIRDNFHIMGRGTVSDEAVADSLRKVGLWHIVDKNGGLDIDFTPNLFSQGQKQLFSLACALVRSGKILVLDEFTSSVDRETDRRMQEVIQHHFRDTTVIVVAHRLDTVTQCDRVCVLQDGQVVEAGKPKELLENPQSIFCGLRGGGETRDSIGILGT